jgi:hypothetical protein
MASTGLLDGGQHCSVNSTAAAAIRLFQLYTSNRCDALQDSVIGTVTTIGLSELLGLVC